MSRAPAPRRGAKVVNGIVLLDKPLGASSNKALQQVKRLFGARKAGHTGSLDPLATGMLPICLGEATKIAGLLLGSRKCYRAEARLGVTTSSGDAEGEVVSRRTVPPLDKAQVEAAMQAFRGRILQVPPVYSAIKQDGVPLYKRTRRGEAVAAPPREVEIFRFQLLALAPDSLRVEVECGSGTYIRSLMSDLGDALGCGAYVTALHRVSVAPFCADGMRDMASLEAAVADSSRLAETLLPVDAGLAGLPRIDLDASQCLAVTQGRRIEGSLDGLGRAYAEDGRLLALLEPAGDGQLAVRRGFNLSPGE